MLPVIAIVGRPNVGKSTLFNRFTRSRDALVVDEPGVTRDRQYGQGRLEDKQFIVIDTGGIGEHDETNSVDVLMANQAKQAMNEADIILFLVDAKQGVTATDEILATQFRAVNKPLYLIANKTDGLNSDVAVADFYRLSLGNPVAIAASHGTGVHQLLQTLLEKHTPEATEHANPEGIKLAIVGRPNVGKSTLVNRILGEERVIVFDQPGTTRDSIFIELERYGKHYTLIDTAGLRRRGKVSDTVEKFSAIKTLQAINEANVVAMLIDANTEISHQDLYLLSYILDSGKALVLAINKWDGLPQENKDFIRKEIDRKLYFVNFAKLHFISALHGTGVGELFDSVNIAYESAMRTFSTNQLTTLLEKAIIAHQPPLVRGRRIKLRYAHSGGQNPPIIVIHGNQLGDLPKNYVRYLTQYFRKALKLIGTPLRLQFKTGDNPYKDRKNILTVSQKRKRKRMMDFFKKK